MQVANIDAARHIAVGLNFSCASLADGTIRCWGSNQWGELGNGTKIDSTVAVDVAGLQSVPAIGTGILAIR